MTQVPSARLPREWALCALAAAASRFVPVPLLDDAIKDRATRTAVARTWHAHGRADSPATIDVLCAGTSGFWTGVGSTVARLPLTLLLYPVRKPVRIVTAVRGVGRDLAEVLLLARAVDRCLTSGWFGTTEPGELRRQAVLVRAAHEQTVASTDLRVLEHGMRAALRRVGGLGRHAREFARVTFGRDAATPAPDEGIPVADGSVERGVQQVEATLARPDVVGLLADLDRRFDAALLARAGAPPPVLGSR